MEVKPAAQLMPVSAEIVADLRRILGTERVDAAIKASQQASREFKRLEASHGLAQAQAWLRRQTFPQGRFFVEEGGRTVGIQRAQAGGTR